MLEQHLRNANRRESPVMPPPGQRFRAHSWGAAFCLIAAGLLIGPTVKECLNDRRQCSDTEGYSAGVATPFEQQEAGKPECDGQRVGHTLTSQVELGDRNAVSRLVLAVCAHVLVGFANDLGGSTGHHIVDAAENVPVWDGPGGELGPEQRELVSYGRR